MSRSREACPLASKETAREYLRRALAKGAAKCNCGLCRAELKPENGPACSRRLNELLGSAQFIAAHWPADKRARQTQSRRLRQTPRYLALSRLSKTLARADSDLGDLWQTVTHLPKEADLHRSRLRQLRIWVNCTIPWIEFPTPAHQALQGQGLSERTLFAGNLSWKHTPLTGAMLAALAVCVGIEEPTNNRATFDNNRQAWTMAARAARSRLR